MLSGSFRIFLLFVVFLLCIETRQAVSSPPSGRALQAGKRTLLFQYKKLAEKNRNLWKVAKPLFQTPSEEQCSAIDKMLTSISPRWKKDLASGFPGQFWNCGGKEYLLWLLLEKQKNPSRDMLSLLRKRLKTLKADLFLPTSRFESCGVFQTLAALGSNSPKHRTFLLNFLLMNSEFPGRSCLLETFLFQGGGTGEVSALYPKKEEKLFKLFHGLEIEQAQKLLHRLLRKNSNSPWVEALYFEKFRSEPDYMHTFAEKLWHLKPSARPRILRRMLMLWRTQPKKRAVFRQQQEYFYARRDATMVPIYLGLWWEQGKEGKSCLQQIALKLWKVQILGAVSMVLMFIPLFFFAFFRGRPKKE